MPIGRYRVLDGDGYPVGTEDFRCAPGPMGWRYFSTVQVSAPDHHVESIDVSVDGSWRPVRVRIDTGVSQVAMRPFGDRIEGVRDGAPFEEAWDAEREIDYRSPCFNAVTANRLGAPNRLGVAADGGVEIAVLYLEAVTLESRIERQRYELEGEEEVRTPVGVFRARRWRYTALSTGWTRPLWVAGDTVVAYEGTYELVSYEPGAHGPVPRR